METKECVMNLRLVQDLTDFAEIYDGKVEIFFLKSEAVNTHSYTL